MARIDARLYPKAKPVFSLLKFVDSYCDLSCITPSIAMIAINKRHVIKFGKNRKSDNKVYTPEISPLITLQATKKGHRSVQKCSNGATEQNLLKLFEWIFNNPCSNLPSIPLKQEKNNVIIY